MSHFAPSNHAKTPSIRVNIAELYHYVNRYGFKFDARQPNRARLSSPESKTSTQNNLKSYNTQQCTAQTTRFARLIREPDMNPTPDASGRKKTTHILRSTGKHWVGDGFPVQTLFAYPEHGTLLSPFLLLDYAGPMEFPPTERRLGVGEHPHRGFETVTIAYSGAVEHRDSSGGTGRIGPGDVQWMTAASGVVHEEFHARTFARQGGMFEMIQLWINLPAAHKMDAPRYQTILDGQIPVVELPDRQGRVRVIAGNYAGISGPAQTVTPLHVWDLRLSGTQPIRIVLPEHQTVALLVLKGECHLHDHNTPLHSAEIAVFERQHTHLDIKRADDVTALLLCGEPIREPIVGSGPFVMNTAAEIHQAFSDYQSGAMGHLS